MTIHRLRLVILSLALLCMATVMGPALLYAQSTTQGAIAGSVLDTTGAAVPGASVTVLNKATNFSLKMTTDSSGFFKAPLLEPGTYTVSVSAPNFAAYRADNVTVVVGQTTPVIPKLGIASSSAEVIVTEQAPVINLDSPDFAPTLSQNAIQNVPINNRRWSALALTTPGVNVDSSGYGLISVRGISTLLNTVLIDGADDNQAFFSEERGRTREAYSTSGNAVREFAVNTGVYSAQYGRAAGGVVTSVTKSGTNGLHGQLYFYNKESNWNAFNNYTTITSLVNGANVTTHIKPKDLRKIYGFTAGGALIKDKLFWIYTYDQHSHIFPVVGVPSSPVQFYTLPQAVLSTGETCNTTTGALAGAPAAAINDAQACALASRQQISYTQASYDWAALLLGSSSITASNYAGATAITDVGLNSAAGTVGRLGMQEINTPKVDWQINSKNRFSVLFHRLRWDSPGGVQTTASDSYSQDSQGNDFVKLDYGVAKLTSLITSNISNELLYQYGRELDYETQQPLTQFTKDHLMSGSNVAYATGFSYGFNVGSPYYSYRVAYPDERKWQVGDIVYWNKRSHSFRFGVDILHNSDKMNNTFQSNGSFSYKYVGNFFNDILNKKNGVANSAGFGCDSTAAEKGSANTGVNPCYSSFSQGFGNPIYAINTLDFGAFAQDNWKVTPRLTLELGVRWDKETIPAADTNLTTPTGTFVPYTGMTNTPSDNKDFGPRVGFSYDIFGRGETVLRGGYGLYFGRITNGNIENIRLNTGSPNGQISRTWNTSTAGGPAFPTIISSASAAACTSGTSSCPSSYFFGSNVKLPEVQEIDLQLQQVFPKSTYVSVSYLGGFGRRLPNYLDVNLDPTSMATRTITVAGDPNGSGPLGATGASFTQSGYTKFGNTALLGASAANFGTVGEMVSNVNSSYNALVAEVVNHSLKYIDFDLNYTWSHSMDYSQNANTQGAYESWYDPYGNGRINYGNSSWNIPNRIVGWALVHVPNLHTSHPIKWATNGWSINDSFQIQNGLPFSGGISGAPNSGTYAVGSGLNNSGGPSFLPQVGINTFKYPRRIVDDIRVQKEFSFEHGINAQFILNAFNLANHQNITAYSYTALYVVSGTTATYTGQDGTGNKQFRVVTNTNNSNFTYSPRQLEIAFRLNF